MHGSTCRKRKGAVTEQPHSCSWFLGRQGKGFRSRATQGSDFRKKGHVKAQETLAHCWLQLSSPPLPPKSQSSSISKDATALAEPPSSPLTSSAPPSGEFGFPCLQQMAGLPQDLVSCSKAKIEVYCQHCPPVPAIQQPRGDPA